MFTQLSLTHILPSALPDLSLDLSTPLLDLPDLSFDVAGVSFDLPDVTFDVLEVSFDLLGVTFDLLRSNASFGASRDWTPRGVNALERASRGRIRAEKGGGGLI
jgi:hypothetical protein